MQQPHKKKLSLKTTTSLDEKKPSGLWKKERSGEVLEIFKSLPLSADSVTDWAEGMPGKWPGIIAMMVGCVIVIAVAVYFVSTSSGPDTTNFWLLIIFAFPVGVVLMYSMRVISRR